MTTTHPYYRAMSIVKPRQHVSNQNNPFGVAFEIEKPVITIFKSFWNVLTSPVDNQKLNKVRR